MGASDQGRGSPLWLFYGPELLCKDFMEKVGKTNFGQCLKSFADYNVIQSDPHSQGVTAPVEFFSFQRTPPSTRDSL